jgi:L-Ala-D/L-Glu epimerase
MGVSKEVRLTLRVEDFPFKEPFRISGHAFDRTRVLVAEIDDGTHRGRGEGAGVYYLGDDLDHMVAEAESARAAVEAGATRTDLQSLLPAGGARNALDCAFWDLEAKRAGTPAWRLAGLDRFEPLPTTMTIGAGTPEEMASAAAGRFRDWPMLKLKLTGEADLDAARARAVRAARADAWIGVDANQGYSREGLEDLLAVLAEVGAVLLEQPVPRGAEASLDGAARPIQFAADESVCTLAEVEAAAGRFDIVNIKLDKCGGLTEALTIAERCRALGVGVMVGNMMGSSLSMAPSLVVGQLCDVVDLDGPTFLAEDRPGGVIYRDGRIAAGTLDWGLIGR